MAFGAAKYSRLWWYPAFTIYVDIQLAQIHLLCFVGDSCKNLYNITFSSCTYIPSLHLFAMTMSFSLNLLVYVHNCPFSCLDPDLYIATCIANSPSMIS